MKRPEVAYKGQSDTAEWQKVVLQSLINKVRCSSLSFHKAKLLHTCYISSADSEPISFSGFFPKGHIRSFWLKEVNPVVFAPGVKLQQWHKRWLVLKRVYFLFSFFNGALNLVIAGSLLPCHQSWKPELILAGLMLVGMMGKISRFERLLNCLIQTRIQAYLEQETLEGSSNSSSQKSILNICQGTISSSANRNSIWGISFLAIPQILSPAKLSIVSWKKARF